MKTSELFRRAEEITYECVRAGKEEFFPAPAELLLQQPAPGKWSAAQCLEHLNACGRHYIPAMNRAVAQARNQGTGPAENHSFGLSAKMAIYFIKVSDNQSVPKIKIPTFKHVNPTLFTKKTDLKETLETFIDQQNEYAKILQDAALFSLKKAKVPLLISFLKWPIGDALLFVIEHNKRHLEQARRALAASRLSV